MAFRAGCLALFMIIYISQAYSRVEQEIHPVIKEPYTNNIEELQSKIQYQFKDKVLLTKALTHASFSQDNNGALNILGSEIIKAAISFRYLWKISTISKGDLASQMVKLSNCGAVLKDAFDLELHELIRVAPKMDPKEKSIACGCYCLGLLELMQNVQISQGRNFGLGRDGTILKDMQKHFPQQDLNSERLDAFE